MPAIEPLERVVWEYTKTGKTFTVGFYSPDDKWHPESDWADEEAAVRRVQQLNS